MVEDLQTVLCKDKTPPRRELRPADLEAAGRGLVAKVEIIDNVAHVHGPMIERMTGRLGQEV